LLSKFRPEAQTPTVYPVRLSTQFPLSIVVVPGMLAISTALLAERLASKCELPLRECQPGDLLPQSCSWNAPGEYHIVVKQDENRVRIGMHQGPRENFCRPSVDLLFRAVAAVNGANAPGVNLTGMGQDGLKGCEALCAAGASVIVQDEASRVVWGMPGVVARAGLAEKILPLDQIGGEIIRRIAAQPSFQLTHQS
jgi:two-component system, chemotaxis family, protein-glutamate methylesterase/glutaminase